MSTYGGLLKKHCINCINAINDPEVGYACKKGKLPDWRKFCDDYAVDAEFVRKEAESFIARCDPNWIENMVDMCTKGHLHLGKENNNE